VHAAALIPWLDPQGIIHAAGPWALLVVCAIVFAETGLLIGFLFPGDTLLLISGLLSHSTEAYPNGVFGVNVWFVALAIAVAAFIGGEAGYLIGHKGGPAIFERKDSGLFSRQNVERTNAFFERYGGMTVVLARFVPVVRTFAPIVAGVGHMPWRRYTLYNLIGAVLWGFGITLLGYAIGFIPWVADIVTKYIDVILLGVVVLTIAVTLFHYFRERAKARREAVDAENAETPAEHVDLALPEDVFAPHTRRAHRAAMEQENDEPAD
jgi:membrane-associated protein